MTKIFSLDFLTYFLENEQVWFVLKESWRDFRGRIRSPKL
jgi:hypothetical protein